MSQAERLLELFHANGDRLTLGQILGAWDVVGSKYTCRLSEIRGMGYTVTCEQNRENPTKNVYTIEKIQTVYTETTGQRVMVFK